LLGLVAAKAFIYVLIKGAGLSRAISERQGTERHGNQGDEGNKEGMGYLRIVIYLMA
jgi:hypothetical protein